jgi:HAD superfamily hydrolase (TIGR01450 family)
VAIDLTPAVAGAFMFDVDGTLAHRTPDGRAHPQPGALEVLDRIRASGRPLVCFTNASHVPSATVAAGLRRDGIEVSDMELLTPTDSASSYLQRYHAGQPVKVFAPDPVKEFFRGRGISVADDGAARVVFVGHQAQVDLDEIEQAARAIDAGAALLTSSYVRGYAGAHGIIYSRGAMITAALAKATGKRPRIVGKPSRAAVAELVRRVGVPSKRIAVIGDDASMDIALGKLGGCPTVLVRSGISGAVDIESLAPRQRPDVAIDGVAEILDWL